MAADATLTYRPRERVLLAEIRGRSFRVPADSAPAVGEMWSWHEAVQPGGAAAPGGARRLTIAQAAPLEAFDYPGAYAGRFDGVDRAKPAPPCPPRTVVLRTPRVAVHLHGPAPARPPHTVVVTQGWDGLYAALRQARQVSFVVEV